MRLQHFTGVDLDLKCQVGIGIVNFGNKLRQPRLHDCFRHSEIEAPSHGSAVARRFNHPVAGLYQLLRMGEKFLPLCGQSYAPSCPIK
ncbi:hypothetical protein D3C80_1855230 [compost metagenome]